MQAGRLTGGERTVHLQSVSAFWSVNKACTFYSKMHDITFGDADAGLGGVLAASLKDGSVFGTRGHFGPP